MAYQVETCFVPKPGELLDTKSILKVSQLNYVPFLRYLIKFLPNFKAALHVFLKSEARQPITIHYDTEVSNSLMAGQIKINSKYMTFK